MVKRKELTEAECESVLVYSEERYSQTMILKKMKISRGCVQKTLKRFQNTRSHANKARSGRPKKTLTRQDRQIKRIFFI